MTYLIGATIFFGCIWLLGAMFSGSKEGGTDAVKGCGSCLLIVLAIGVGILGIYTLNEGQKRGDNDFTLTGMVLIALSFGLFELLGIGL